MVITTQKVFNIHKSSVKREFAIKELSGISYNSIPKKMEFVLHLPESYDYRYNSEKRQIIIEVM